MGSGWINLFTEVKAEFIRFFSVFISMRALLGK